MTERDSAQPGHGCDASNELSLPQAHERVAATVEPVTTAETVSLRGAVGRVLATDVRSRIDIPPADNAAMDGYALRAADLDDSGRAELHVIGTAWAGHPLDRTIGPRECARIMTGAPVPHGANTVVMQERTRLDGDRIHIERAEAGANIRRAGEDIATGDQALAAGTHLAPAEVGVLASLGMTEVAVIRRLRVVLFASGDEITEPGRPLTPGRLYDSNRYAVHAMLDQPGIDLDDRGHLPDERAAVEASLLAAAAEADLIVTTGGVSVGAADYIGSVLQAHGETIFRSVAVKPGRPLHFGRLDQSLFFGLPGNPVSVMVTYCQFVQPALRRLAGAAYRQPVTLRARAARGFDGKPGRTEFQRATLRVDANGVPVVESAGPQGSGRLSSMARADCLVVIPAERGDIAAGEWVDVQPFHGLF